MSEAKSTVDGRQSTAEEREDEEASASAEAGALIASAKLAGDVDGLLKLAKQFRAGAAGAPRDMKACFAAYSAAADLGSPLAAHAVGLFHLNGGAGIEKSERDAALRFRSAADQGHLGSKVYVGNFYELGIHYRADAAKADVWYRNVARSAGVEAEPGTPEYARALADLGCVRYCLELAEAEGTSDADRARYRRLAKTYGYQPPGGRASITGEAAQLEALGEMDAAPASKAPLLPGPGADATAAPTEAKKTGPADETPSAEKKKERVAAGPKVTVGLGATAFFLSLIFMGIGAVSGHVLHGLARAEVAAGGTVPIFGAQPAAILPVFVVALGVLPNMLVYRRSAFVKAALLGGLFALAGELSWHAGRHVLESRVMQITDFGAVGVLIGLLLFGIFGGVHPGSR